MEKFEGIDDRELEVAAGGAPGVKTNWGATGRMISNMAQGKPGGFWGGYGQSGGGGSSGGGGGGGQRGGGGGR